MKLMGRFFSLLICIANVISFFEIGAANETDLELNMFAKEKEAKREQFPYIMRLIEAGSNDTTCVGALITKSSVLSAAVCVCDYKGKVLPCEEYEGLFGSVQSGVNETRVKFRDFRVHEAYNPQTAANEVSILILEERVTLNEFINIVALPRKGVTFDGQRLAALGWEMYQFDDRFSIEVLRYAEVKVLNSTECFLYATDDQHVCIQFKQKILCGNGEDYGSPLVRKGPGIDTSVGINSCRFVPNGWNSSTPYYYLSTSAYYDWIKQNADGEITYA